MVSKSCAAVVLLCAAAAAAHAQQQFQVFASILDGGGRPVASLEPADVRVMENDVAATVVKAEPIAWPVKLQLLVDNGVGLGSGNLIHLRNGVRGLIEALPAGIELTLVTTAPQPRTVVRPTSDREAMLKGVDLLAPDSGAGRFVESLSEATQRIEKDTSDHFPVIVALGSTAGDRNVMERDVERLMQRLQRRPATVHVVLLVGTTSASGGANQTEVGLAVTKMTGGRYEGINAPVRLATLLPELGAQVATSHERQSRQYRITVQRPAGASGALGAISLATRTGLRAAGLSLDGRLP